MRTFHAIEIKYLGPTDYRGGRMKLYSARFKTAVTLSRDYSFDGLAQAERYLERAGFQLAGYSETKDGDVILSTTFEPLK